MSPAHLDTFDSRRQLTLSWHGQIFVSDCRSQNQPWPFRTRLGRLVRYPVMHLVVLGVLVEAITAVQEGLLNHRPYLYLTWDVFVLELSASQMSATTPKIIAISSRRVDLSVMCIRTLAGGGGCLVPDNNLELLRVIIWPVAVGGCCSLAVFEEGALFDLEDVAAC